MFKQSNIEQKKMLSFSKNLKSSQESELVFSFNLYLDSKKISVTIRPEETIPEQIQTKNPGTNTVQNNGQTHAQSLGTSSEPVSKHLESFSVSLNVQGILEFKARIEEIETSGEYTFSCDIVPLGVMVYRNIKLDQYFDDAQSQNIVDFVLTNGLAPAKVFAEFQHLRIRNTKKPKFDMKDVKIEGVKCSNPNEYPNYIYHPNLRYQLDNENNYDLYLLIAKPKQYGSKVIEHEKIFIYKFGVGTFAPMTTEGIFCSGFQPLATNFCLVEGMDRADEDTKSFFAKLFPANEAVIVNHSAKPDNRASSQPISYRVVYSMNAGKISIFKAMCHNVVINNVTNATNGIFVSVNSIGKGLGSGGLRTNASVCDDKKEFGIKVHEENVSSKIYKYRSSTGSFDPKVDLYYSAGLISRIELPLDLSNYVKFGNPNDPSNQDRSSKNPFVLKPGVEARLKISDSNNPDYVSSSKIIELANRIGAIQTAYNNVIHSTLVRQSLSIELNNIIRSRKPTENSNNVDFVVRKSGNGRFTMHRTNIETNDPSTWNDAPSSQSHQNQGLQNQGHQGSNGLGSNGQSLDNDGAVNVDQNLARPPVPHGIIGNVWATRTLNIILEKSTFEVLDHYKVYGTGFSDMHTLFITVETLRKNVHLFEAYGSATPPETFTTQQIAELIGSSGIRTTTMNFVMKCLQLFNIFVIKGHVNNRHNPYNFESILQTRLKSIQAICATIAN